MVRTGLRLVIGSWKIMETSLPRTLHIWSSVSSARLIPPSMIRPSTRPLTEGTRRMIDKAVTLLPDPDSPTIATVSRGLMSKERLRTTGRHTPSTRKEVVSPSTDRTGLSVTVRPSVSGQSHRATHRPADSGRTRLPGSQGRESAPARSCPGCSRTPRESCRPRSVSAASAPAR